MLSGQGREGHRHQGWVDHMIDITPDIHSLTPLAKTLKEIGDTTDDANTKMLASIAATLVVLVSEVGRLRRAVEKGWEE